MLLPLNQAQKLSDFISNFDNSSNTLYVYDKYGNHMTMNETIIGSHMVMKLIVDGIVYDELTIVVREDFNGNGFVSITDLVYSKNTILGINEETYIVNKIGDITLDGYISVTDLMAVKNYMLGITEINQDKH